LAFIIRIYHDARSSECQTHLQGVHKVMVYATLQELKSVFVW